MPTGRAEVQRYSFFNLGTRSGRVTNATRRPLYPRERDPAPVLQEAGCAPEPVGRVRKISPSPGFDPRSIQPVASRYTDYPKCLYNSLAFIYVLNSAKCRFTQRVTSVICSQEVPSSNLGQDT